MAQLLSHHRATGDTLAQRLLYIQAGGGDLQHSVPQQMKSLHEASGLAGSVLAQDEGTSPGHLD